MTEKILTDAEGAAAALDVSKRVFYQIRERERLPVVQLAPKIIRYRVADLAALAERLANAAPLPPPENFATPDARAKRAATLAARRTARPSKAPPGADSAPSPGVTRHRIPA